MLRRLLIVLLVALATVSPVLARQLLVTVDISEQSMRVGVDGDTWYRWDVSTGRKGYRTPRGTFHPVRLERMWYSTRYDSAPMPHAIFFFHGYAIHGTTETRSLGRPVSHGCIRLHHDNAAELYALVRRVGRANTIIRVRD
ncbi:L,D-transpeptidase [Devosia sp.]|uniref:L,D-transpeptidase n=1 Tax=Devosia sp. TaxID=1871048 RepID=UPI002F0ECE08